MAAIRPRSLTLAVSPVAVGTALAFARSGAIDAQVAGLALAAALLMQVVTNLQNDVGHTLRVGAAAAAAHPGLPRATAQGWLGVRELRFAIALAALLAAAAGLALVALRGWPVLAIGLISLAAALAYMGGPRPIAYTPLGEATVFVFFGPVAVGGTDWLLTGGVTVQALAAGAAIGALAAAALAINNRRDLEHDRAVGRRSFAVLFGAAAARRLFEALLLAPFALVVGLAFAASSPAPLLPLALLPRALALRRDFARAGDAAAFNPLLLRCFGLVPAFALLLAAGVVAARLF
jgi:1,4-dihydroxy-2-naphthoate polyprenyltransferase